MGKKDAGNSKGKGSSRVKKTSSGNRRGARIRAQLQRLNMKIARWNNYRNEGKSCATSKGHKCSPKCASRHNNWNVEKMCEHAQLLERALKDSKKKRFVSHGET